LKRIQKKLVTVSASIARNGSFYRFAPIEQELLLPLQGLIAVKEKYTGSITPYRNFASLPIKTL